MTDNPVWRWFDDTFLDLGRQFRWSYLPPLMIYLAAGVQGLTAIVGTFFIKEYLDLSAAFLAGLAFWVGIPWTLKMPLGHLVDLIWRRKALLVYIGAGLITLSILIMYGIIAHTQAMAEIMGVEIWFVIATLLAPTGYVVQDVVADAMTVEAVPTINEHGDPYPDDEIKVMHTTMQTLGRFAIIGGLAAVAALNITMFSGVEDMSEEMKVAIYADIYLMALAIPVLSISGVILGGVILRRRAQRMREQGQDHAAIDKLLFAPAGETHPNWWILGGSLVFAIFTLTMGISQVPLAQEIIFIGSMSIILFLMYRLMLELDPEMRNMLIGTAVIIFVFRATPLPGPGATWFEIDVLGFDQQFLSVLSLIASLLTLARHGRAAANDGEKFNRICHRNPDHCLGYSSVTEHRTLLRPARMDRSAHRRCCRRAFYRDHRHHDGITAGSDLDDPDAGMDCEECAATFESDIFRGDGVIHQPRAVGLQPGHPLPERNLHGDT